MLLCRPDSGKRPLLYKSLSGFSNDRRTFIGLMCGNGKRHSTTDAMPEQDVAAQPHSLGDRGEIDLRFFINEPA